MYDVIIVGGGPASLSCAMNCARGGLSVLVLESQVVGGKMNIADKIENYPGINKEINGMDLALDMKNAAEKFGAQIKYETVQKINYKEKKVYTRRNEYQAKVIVIATGSKEKTIGIEGEGKFIGRGISYCATCDGAFFKGKTVAVVGGGDSAVEYALYLSDICQKVYLIHRRQEFRASKITVDAAKKCANVEFLLDTQLSKIGGDDKVSHIVTQDGRVIDVEGVFIAIGSTPMSELYTKSGKYIKTNEQTKTRRIGVFAIGDVREKSLRQVVTATGDGAICAHAILQYVKEGVW